MLFFFVLFFGGGEGKVNKRITDALLNVCYLKVRLFKFFKLFECKNGVTPRRCNLYKPELFLNWEKKKEKMISEVELE